jgi:hypothetical protein
MPLREQHSPPHWKLPGAGRFPRPHFSTRVGRTPFHSHSGQGPKERAVAISVRPTTRTLVPINSAGAEAQGQAPENRHRGFPGGIGVDSTKRPKY